MDGRLFCRARAEAPTTVEEPFADITLGVLDAIEQIERATGRRLLHEGRIIHPASQGQGADYVGASCSAGGGLQILVAGVIKSMTAASAERAALGAGAIVTDVVSIDDGRSLADKLYRISTMRPDIVLISGGVDGGNVSHVVQMAELLYAAGVKPRHGEGAIPIIYAGNRDAKDEITDILARGADTRVVENLRPQLEIENIAPARQEIQESFMSHVMVRAPRYSRLAGLMTAPVLPTPLAVGKAVSHIGETTGKSVMACDIGGATTDLFAYTRNRLYRTVSANLGMSYSICNVASQAGLSSVQQFLPYASDETELANTLANKMIRPTSLPMTPSDLALEQAVARVALSLAFKHHQTLMGEIRGVQRKREVSDTLRQDEDDRQLLAMRDVDIIVGSGSVLAMAPRRSQAMAMLLDGFGPEGYTEIMLDGQFLLPQVGLISDACPELAWDLLWNQGLLRLGSVIAPIFRDVRPGAPLARVTLRSKSKVFLERVIRAGDLYLLPLDHHEPLNLDIAPFGQIDVGLGPGRVHSVRTSGGLVGLVFDGRGRPLMMPVDAAGTGSPALYQARVLDLFPESVLADFARRGGVRL